MYPETEPKRVRAPRLRPGGVELVRQSVETGVILNLTPRQQLVLRGRYLSEDDQPPSQEMIAAKLYPDKDPRGTKHNISGLEQAGFRRLEALLGQR